MIQIIPVSHLDDRVKLGQACDFQVQGLNTGSEIRCFLKHKNIFYFKPLTDWSVVPSLHIFPEAPGNYRLMVESRAPNGEHGKIERPFTVSADSPADSNPTIASIEHKRSLWMPSPWEARRLHGYEKSVVDFLAKVIQPGWAVYDIGANLGVYALQFSKLVGSQGQVYCIEANPVCIYFLRANLEMNKAVNCEILPIALLDRTCNTDFTINYSNSALGLTQDSAFYSTKAGHVISVQAYSFDELLENFGLHTPDFIKIDIEGAEHLAIAGMAVSLAKYRPALLIEIHGKPAAEKTLHAVDWAGYRFIHQATHTNFSNDEELLSWFPDSIQQIYCLPI